MFAMLLIVQTIFASLSIADTGYSNAEFLKNPYDIALATQPMWFFAAGSCYPQPASDEGHQHIPHAASGCWLNPTRDGGAGCTFQIPWMGPLQKGINVPTYYAVRHRASDDTWQIYYGLYFDHDQGHKNDWEWVIVVFKNLNHMYHRHAIIMEQDGKNAEYSWTDKIVQTFMNATDMWDDDLGGQERNHPKVYVSKMHHSMWPNRCTGGIKDACYGTYRPDDWYKFDFGNASNLIDIATEPSKGGIDPKWNFGSATNPWKTVDAIQHMHTRHGDANKYCGPGSGFVVQDLR